MRSHTLEAVSCAAESSFRKGAHEEHAVEDFAEELLEQGAAGEAGP